MELFTPTARARLVSEMFRHGVDLPEGLMTKAFRVLNEAMEATEIKFFSHKGFVKQQKEVVDHGIRIAAARETLTIAQMLTREKEQDGGTHTVAMEYDEKKAVLRLVVTAGGDVATEINVRSVAQKAFGPSDIPTVTVEESLDDKLKKILLDEIVE
jgi:hypothetical protein